MKKPKDFPWKSLAALEAELAVAWEGIKHRGIDAGVLVPGKDGTLRGKGHPNKLFDKED